MYDVIELSEYIITKCKNDGCPIKNIQLQFILYAIQEQFLKQNRLAFENDFEAWKFGVCCPDAFYRFCGHGVQRRRFWCGYTKAAHIEKGTKR